MFPGRGRSSAQEAVAAFFPLCRREQSFSKNQRSCPSPTGRPWLGWSGSSDPSVLIAFHPNTFWPRVDDLQGAGQGVPLLPNSPPHRWSRQFPGCLLWARHSACFQLSARTILYQSWRTGWRGPAQCPGVAVGMSP